SYLDTIWSRNRTVGGAPLQRRVVWLLESLGLHARNVAASNLIFFRSRDAAGSQFRRFATLCWPVHERIIQIVRPRLVIVYGNSGVSPFSYLLNEYKTAGGRDLLLGPRRLEMSQFRCARSLSRRRLAALEPLRHNGSRERNRMDQADRARAVPSPRRRKHLR